MNPNHEIINSRREEYPVGTRVRLILMNDPHAPPVGTHGTVICVDDMATIHVDWDTGNRLGAVWGEDIIAKL